MKGSYRIQASFKGVYWDITLQRKVSVLLGYSGSGKTALCNAVNAGRVRCPVPVLVIETGVRQSTLLSGLAAANPGSIIIVDDPGPYISRKDFIKEIQYSDCYFLIITNNVLFELTDSTYDLYELVFDKQTNTLLPITERPWII